MTTIYIQTHKWWNTAFNSLTHYKLFSVGIALFPTWQMSETHCQKCLSDDVSLIKSDMSGTCNSWYCSGLNFHMTCNNQRAGEQEWHSGEKACPPPMWPGSNSGRVQYGVIFVIGSWILTIFLSGCLSMSRWTHFLPCDKSLHDSQCNPTCICALFPAVILEIVQHASFRMLSLELLSKCNRLGSALQLRITYQLKAKLVVIKITGIQQIGIRAVIKGHNP